MVKLRKKASFGRRVCRQHTGAFKAQVALAALREGKTMAQLCQEFDPHANQITEWKRQLLERAADGRGAWRDNVFVERLWRTVKYEHVYKHVYACVGEAKSKIAKYLDWYNTGRVHSSLDDQTPDQAYWDKLPKLAVAA